MSTVNSFASENMYQGYNETINLSTGEITSGIRIKDGQGNDGKDSIVYCYDLNYSFPSAENSENKTYYKRIDNYLESNDKLTEIYGKDKKVRIATVLTVGYPNDSYGYMKKYGISDNDARYMTQNLIWDITNGRDGAYVAYGRITKTMAEYANAILELSKTNIFEQGKLSLEGKLEFTQHENWWCTNKLSTTGDRGEFRFKDVPSGFKIIDWNTDKEIVGNLSVGQEFYIKSSNKPSPETKFELEYEYETVKIYFYECLSGKEPIFGKNYQNLVRSELTNKKNKISLEIKINGDFNQIIVGESGNKTWTENTAEGISGSLPDGTVIETEEESGNGIVETDENTTEGISGSLPDGTVIETEEESGNGIVETDENTTKKNNKDSLERSLDNSPKTGDQTNLGMYMLLSLASIAGIFATLVPKRRTRQN
ncbi:TPA: thioester-forming surface-anchored protein [Clostridioides difficile]|nr:thioester-forming surface-anchored protein [Clostridioides difficile]